jgi:hypothetical protein
MGNRVKKLTQKKILKKLKREAHKLWRECILLKFGGKCIVCLDTIRPNCHHIVPEQMFAFLRYHPDNGVVLCPKHHKFNKFSAHKNALWFVRIVLPKVVSEEIICVLINEMQGFSTDTRFVWTVDDYNRAICILKERLSKKS